MSGKRAAEALLELDTELAASVAELSQGYSFNKRDQVLQIVRECVLGTWTLTLAARAAGVAEEVVVSALLHKLRIGSTCICRGEAKLLFSDDAPATKEQDDE
jgi:hypothetical protein